MSIISKVSRGESEPRGGMFEPSGNVEKKLRKKHKKRLTETGKADILSRHS